MWIFFVVVLFSKFLYVSPRKISFSSNENTTKIMKLSHHEFPPPSPKPGGGGGGGYSVQMTIRGRAANMGPNFAPFGISMTPYFFRFGGIRVGGKSLLVYQWGLITFWYINGS